MKIVKDAHVLTQNFIPEKILVRNDIYNKIEHAFLGLEGPSTIVIKGNPGTGKTLLSKYIIKQHPEYNSKYVNCYITPSDRGIINELISKGEYRGDLQSAGTERLVKVLIESIPGEKNLIVLDETQNLKKSTSSIIYLLSRSVEIGGPPIKLMLLTIEDPEIFMDKSTLAGLGVPKVINLKEYDSSELYEIIRQRVTLSLYEGMYENDALTRIAELSEETGSARVALELLNRSIMVAESRGSILDGESVLNAYREFSPPIEENSLLDLENWELMLLTQIIDISTDSKFKSSDVRQILPAQSDARIYKFLRHLENSGFIKKIKVGKGYGGGVENEYVFRLPLTLLSEKLGKMEK